MHAVHIPHSMGTSRWSRYEIVLTRGLPVYAISLLGLRILTSRLLPLN